MNQPLYERILERIDQSAGDTACWPWLGVVGPTGYGTFSVRRGVQIHSRPAHRVVFELFCHPIPEGLELDHTCRNRACVNPDHLEPVTPAENVRRAVAAKTHCVHGHPWLEETIYTEPRSGHRRCRVCMTERQRRYRETGSGVAA